MKEVKEEKIQQGYARIAAPVYIFIIVLFMTGEYIISGIEGTGDFSIKASNILASESLYRFALGLQLSASMVTVLLAFSLYMAIKPYNEHLARLAMYWRLGESFLGSIHVIFSFIALRLYTNPYYLGAFEIKQLTSLVYLSRNAYGVAFNISTLLFCFGSLVFFFLFLRSKYLPKSLSILGIFASVMVFFTGFGCLIFPSYASYIEYGWLPMFLSEITTGIWLMYRGVNTQSLTKKIISI